MPELLNLGEPSVDSIGVMAIRLALAAVAGVLVAIVAKLRSDDNTDVTLPITLVMMCVLIAMATQIIGSNVARAFSLVGALSIVRFRTAVSSTQDVAFVLATVVIGMAIGAGQFAIAAIGMVLVAIISVVRLFPASPKAEPPKHQPMLQLMLQATLGSERNWNTSLDELTNYCELVGVETVRRGSALQYEYRVELKKEFDAAAVAQRLTAIPQVETVALKMA